MATTYDDGDRIALTKLDARLLVALLRGPMGMYEIARQAEADITDSARLSTGAVRPAILQLERLMLVREVAPNTAFRPDSARSRRVFKITRLGRQVLEWELQTYQRLLDTAEQRSTTSN